MKTNFFSYLAVPVAALFMLAAACHSGQKNSSEVADSANQKQIARADSANKAEIKASDSTLKAKQTLQEGASKFLVKSYESGMFEMQLSQLAATHALEPEVKTLASDLIAAHTDINEKMKAIAVSANFILPVALDKDHQKDLDDMAKLNGADFDKKYINTIVDGHEKSVSNYKDAYKDLSPGDTKTFAGETLPKIEDHLAMAKKVKDRIK
jgi:putative membrane protein